MATEKIPIRTVYDGATAVGLAEYQVNEVVGVTYGGIGTNTLTSNSILLGNGTSAVQSSSIQIIGTTLSSSDSSTININEGLVVEGNLTVTGSITGTISNSSLTNSSITISDDSSSTSSISLGETLKIAGGSGVDTTLSGDTLTISLESTIVTETSTDTLTNKTISLSTNTITGTLAEFNTALSDANFVSLDGSEVLTNKSISGSSNTLTNIANSSLTNSSITLADDSSSTTSISLGQTLKVAGGSGVDTSISGDTLTISLESTIVTETSSDTLTNKTISGSDNTLTNISNSSLTNSSITIADDSSSTTTISLGETLKVSGTSNEIETTISGDTITIGLPNDVTIAGNLTVNGTTTTVNSTTIDITNSFTFEGSTANEFETVLGVIDPTADRTINLPNVSGTIITTGNLSDITGLSNSQLSNPSFTISDDSSTQATISLGENLAILGGTGLTSTISGDNITIDIDNTVVTLSGSQTLTNKTFTSPKINEDVAITATATELNFTDGVTSNIQTQLDAKAAKSFAIAQAVALG